MVVELKRPLGTASSASQKRIRFPGKASKTPPDGAHFSLGSANPLSQVKQAGQDMTEANSGAAPLPLSSYRATQGGIGFIHIRLAHFYAQATERRHPEWAGKSLIIGGRADQIGRVLDISERAYAAGIRPGMPLRTAARKCKEGLFVEPDWDTYMLALAQVRELYHHYCKRVYSTSRGAAFLDVRGQYQPAFLIAVRLHRELKQLGYVVTIGVASTPVGAERASVAAVQTGGLRVVLPGQEETFLAPFSLSTLPPATPQLIRALQGHGIHTIGHLLRLEPRLVGLQFGENGLLLRQIASGQTILDRAPDSIPAGKEMRWLFPRDLPGDTTLVAVAKLAELLSRQLQAADSPGRLLVLRLRSSHGERIAQTTFPTPTLDQEAIERAALWLFRSLHRKGRIYRGAALRMVLCETSGSIRQSTVS